jgi:hypothetical protein
MRLRARSLVLAGHSAGSANSLFGQASCVPRKTYSLKTMIWPFGKKFAVPTVKNVDSVAAFCCKTIKN